MADLKKKYGEKILAYALKNAIEHEGKAQAGAVLSPLFHEGLKKAQVKEIMPLIQETLKKVNSMNLEEQQKQFAKESDEISHRDVREEGELPELPDSEKGDKKEAKKGKIIMRIAPYPSGPLHIGNTRQLLLNDEYVKRYGGKLFLIIDDTIGNEEKQIILEAYDLIEEGAKWLSVKYSKPVIHKSDRLELYYKYAEEIIKKGQAYVCYCPADELRENRKNEKECEHRKQTPMQAIKEWKKMFEMKEGQATLRIKTSMKHPNPAFRDRVLFRISEREHPRVKKKYKVWPLLEFSWAIDDHLLKMTHVLRGKELMIETDMEKHIMDIFGWKHPVFIHTGLLQFEGVKLSKSKGQKEVKSGNYIGWNDPRLWSLQSLEKRGILPETIRKFIISLGINQNEITVPIDILYSENRKLIRDDAVKASFEKKNNGKIIVLMPDATTVKGNSDVDVKKLKDEQMIYFVGLGYCRYNKDEKVKFWFAHA
jgi:glutamyl-tRNA synthetase